MKKKNLVYIFFAVLMLLNVGSRSASANECITASGTLCPTACTDGGGMCEPAGPNDPTCSKMFPDTPGIITRTDLGCNVANSNNDVCCTTQANIDAYNKSNTAASSGGTSGSSTSTTYWSCKDGYDQKECTSTIQGCPGTYNGIQWTIPVVTSGSVNPCQSGYLCCGQVLQSSATTSTANSGLNNAQVGTSSSHVTNEPGICDSKNFGDSCTLSDGGAGTCVQSDTYVSAGYSDKVCSLNEPSGSQASAAQTASLSPDGTPCADNGSSCQSGQCLANAAGQFTCSGAESSSASNGGMPVGSSGVSDTYAYNQCISDGGTDSSCASLLPASSSPSSPSTLSSMFSGLSKYFPTGGTNGSANPGASGAGGATTTPYACKGDMVSGVCFPSGTGLSNATVGQVLGTFLDWLLGIFTVLAIMAFVISGIQYLISAGDEGMIDTAKNNAKWSVIGIIVGLSGFLMLQAVNALLNGTSQYF